MSSLVKILMTCLRVTLRELETFGITFDYFVGWAVHQTVFSVACNSDSEIFVFLGFEAIAAFRSVALSLL